MENPKLEVVVIPCPLPGHIVSTIEFADRLMSFHPRVEVTILLMKPPTLAPSSSQQQEDREVKTDDPFSDHSNNNTTQRQIRYIHLPEVELPPMELFHDCQEDFLSAYIDLHKSHVRTAMETSFRAAAAARGKLAGIVVDMFNTSMIDVADELGVPSYLFFCSTAGFLGLLLDLPTLNIQFKEHEDDDDGSVSTDSETYFSISTYANPVPSTVLPAAVLNKSGNKMFSYHSKRFAKTKGIIVNTFPELEPYATNSLMNNTQIPPVYNVGPILNLTASQPPSHGGNPNNDNNDNDNIIKWLDNQPDSSVVFICFGSLGSISEPQMKEIATGLAESGIRFLWSLRKPPIPGTVDAGVYTENELKDILLSSSGGFITCLEQGRGMVCGWAPQVDVLGHSAIGGFVSHCGWNSILESLWFGVPIVTWPLYAEQQINAFQIVKELGLGVELRLGDNLVAADEIKNAIGCVMDPDNQVRMRVKEISEISKRAVMDASAGGSSFKAIQCLLKDMETNLA